MANSNKVKYWTCIDCKSTWPAATTIEAYRNHKRVQKIHPETTCKEEVK